METRIYVNRSLRLDKIKCIGFDMDATLAIYKSPVCEEVAFELALERLMDIGYPKEMRRIKYQKDLVVRNAWYDKKFGNLLKTDEHCNILAAFRGFRKLQRKEIRHYYPNKHIALEESRIFVLNTVFNVPETFLLAAVVDYFEKKTGAEYRRLSNGLGYKRRDKQQIILFSTIFEDCRGTIDWIHTQGNFKDVITSNLSKYVEKDCRAVEMLQKLSRNGKKLFLLTNSNWQYTDLVMSYMMGQNWSQLFDVVIVDGGKPKWFLQDSVFRMIDKDTGKPKMGAHSGPLAKGDIYSRGCATEFIQQLGLAGKDILYVGDHIFGDVLKSKKVGGWRTLLIVPELHGEMKIWSSQRTNFNKLLRLNNQLSVSQSVQSASMKKDTLRQISRLTEELEAEFGLMGSMLRCGWRQTHFAAQLKKYADLYTCNVYNLDEYSGSHYFNSPIQLLPHEERIMGTTQRIDDTKTKIDSKEETSNSFLSRSWSEEATSSDDSAYCRRGHE